MTVASDRPSLYETLDVTPAASPEEIRRAYRRKALLYHPDKNPGHEGEFQAIQRAHEVLANPKKRRIYDRYGEFGVSTLDLLKSTALVEALLNTRRLKIACLVLFAAILSAALVPFAVAFRVSGIIATAWRWILLPLLAVILSIAVFGGFLLFLSWKALSAQERSHPPESHASEGGEDEEGELNRDAFIVVATLLCIFLGLVFFQILLLMLRLDGIIGWSLWLIFLPYMVLETLNVVRILITLGITFVNWHAVAEGAPSAFALHLRYPKLYYAFVSLRWSGMRLLGFLLVTLKLSSPREWSWTGVLLPLYLVPSLALVGDFLADRGKRPNEGAPQEIRVLGLQYLMYGIVVGTFLTFVFLLNVRLSYGAPRWSIVFVPVYLVATLLFFLLVGVGILVYWSIPDFEQLSAEALSEIVVENGSRGPSPPTSQWQRRLRAYLGPFNLRIK